MTKSNTATLFKDVIRDGDSVSWVPTIHDVFYVTGVDTNGKRFKIVTKNWHHARGINVYRGTLWLVRDGKRKKIRTYYN